MGTTIKSLILEHGELHQRLRIWEEVMSFLERSHSPTGGVPTNEIRMDNGSPVDPEIVLNVISEIDDIRSASQRRIAELEAMEVSSGKSKSGKKSRPVRGSTAKGGASRSRARKATGKNGGDGGGSSGSSK